MPRLVERLLFEKGFWWYGFCQFLSIAFFLCVYRIRVFGRENVPLKGPVLVASNHQSFFDPVLVGLSLGRPINIIAREGLFRVPVFRRLITSLNAFPIKRGTFDREAIRTALSVLDADKLLLLFPEGTRTRDGDLMPVKAGIGFLAKKGGVPVVPATICGAWRAWPPHAAFFRLFVPVRVSFGPALDPGALGRGELEPAIQARWAADMAKMETMQKD